MKQLKFYRINYASQIEIDDWTNCQTLPDSAIELKTKLQLNDFILAARFDHASKTGKVRSVGLVTHSEKSINIYWRPACFDLTPTQQGCRFWQKSFFRFADSVALRYQLQKKCLEIFPEQNNNTLHDTSNKLSAAAPKAAGDDPGYVYVVKSPHGYKIGKSRRLHDRIRLFSVKLPFPIEVIMAGWFNNHSETERRFHRLFHGKRLDGEWFALNEHDLAILRKEFG